MSRTPEHIPQRVIPFSFPDDLQPQWNPRLPVFSHMVNGASLPMPYLEPFLISAIREGAEQVKDEKLRAEARGFIAQEGQHFGHHRRYNELLKRHGHPELAEIEARMDQVYKKLRLRPLPQRLAYAAGFETMTQGLTRWMVKNRHWLLGGSDSRVASFIMWHLVEETEHKRVAHDIYQAVHGRYWLRVVGLLWASFEVIGFTMDGYHQMLCKDGLWRSPRQRWTLMKISLSALATIGWAMLKSAMPGHDPDDERDPAWVAEWIAAYSARSAADGPPLFDTHSPDIRPVFSA
jgi:predicted metal-dependent hydrolase